MLKARLARQSGVLILRPGGRLRASEFEALAGLADPYRSENGGLAGILIEAPRFAGWDAFAAGISRARFAKSGHRRIRRIAVLADDRFLVAAPALAKHFASAQVRLFPAGRRDAALAWILSG
jgi:hypothetical protein